MPESEYKKLYENSLKEIERLTTMLTEMQKNLQASLDGNNELREQLKAVQEKLDVLLAKKKNRDRKEFGSKSEGHNPRPEPSTTTQSRRQRNEESVPEIQKPTDEPPPAEIVTHEIAANEIICPDCNVETKFVGNTITRELESVLRSLKWIEHRQETRACPKCKSYIRKAPKPEPPIPGSYAGPTLLATIVCNKVEDGLPNYRQERRFARESIPIPRSTQCDWFIATSLSVEPLYELIQKEILKSEIIQTDESQIKVQDRKNKKNIRKGKMIVCRGDSLHKLVCFLYSRNLSFDMNKEFFKGYLGIIQADAAGGFDALFKKDEEGKGATEAGCNAHGRRKIFDAQVMELIIGTEMLDIYDKIYQVERDNRNATPEARLAARQEHSAPLMKRLHSLHVSNKRVFSPTHLLVEAANYALNHWKALTLFLENPHVEIDNNASEREIKAFVLSRKNFLFAGSDAGAKALAIHFTLVASAKRNGLNPVEYLADVFARINQMKLSEIGELLPDRWKKQIA